MSRKTIAASTAALASAALAFAGSGVSLAQEVPNPPDTGSHIWSDHVWFQGTGWVTGDGDGDNGIDLVGDGGTFAFQTNTVAGVPVADCVSDTDLGEAPAPEAGPCFVEGGGNFISEVCGTGAAYGNAVVNGPEPGNADFVIWFNAGVGVAEGTWHDATEGSSEPFTGTVHLAPLDAPSGDDCTHRFSMTVFIDAFEPASGGS